MKKSAFIKKTIYMVIVFAGLIIIQPACAASVEIEAAKIKEVWASFVERLSMTNIDGALEYIVDARKENYREAFYIMKDKISEKMSTKNEIVLKEVNGYMATGENIVRENGEIYSYPITFIKERGKWKIESF